MGRELGNASSSHMWKRLPKPGWIVSHGLTEMQGGPPKYSKRS